ncbi:MAG: response regulator [Ignavibacteriaceae bacterium]
MYDQCRIILAEDDLISAKSIKLSLEKNGLKVTKIVESGEELVNAALNEFPSIIITDITLKGQIDGIEAIYQISEFLKIPYIFITGYQEYLPLICSYNLNPCNIFIKPIEMELFCKSVKEISESLLHVQSQYYLG